MSEQPMQDEGSGPDPEDTTTAEQAAEAREQAEADQEADPGAVPEVPF